MSKAVDDMTPWLYQALGTERGIVLSVSNMQVARARAYKARAQAQDPDLACLQFRPHPNNPEGELMILKGEPPKPSTTETSNGS